MPKLCFGRSLDSNPTMFVSFRKVLILLGCQWLAGLSSPVPSFADGWHNATLGSKSIDNWLTDVRAAIPGFAVNTAASGDGKAAESSGAKAAESSGAKTATPSGERPAMPGLPILQSQRGASNDTPADEGARQRNRLSVEREGNQLNYQPGGVLPTQLTAAQKTVLDRKSRECLEVLAYMDDGNIFPREFPKFPMDRIPEYRKAAKQLLKLMGPTGATVTVNQVRAELMNQVHKRADMHFHACYHDELLELLRHAAVLGWLSDADLHSLEEAASGKKANLQATLAESVQSIVELRGAVIGVMSIEELLDIIKVDGVGSVFLANIGREVGKRLPQAKLAELLRLISEEVPLPFKQVAARHAAVRTFTNAEFRDQLPAVAPFLGAANPEVAQLARTQVAKGMRRATMASCLQWLGAGNNELDQIIRQQIDRRLQSADELGRGNYAKLGIGVLGDEHASLPSRQAAIELLQRLKPEEAVGQVLDLLPKLPPELRPVTTELLKELGKDLGKDLSGSQMQSLIALVEQMQQPGDKVTKTRQEEQLRRRAGTQTIDELLDAANISGLSSLAKARLGTELSKRLATATLTELLGVMNSKVSLPDQQAAIRDAMERPLPIAQLRAQMPALVRFLKATDPQVAELARTRIVEGVRSAAMPDYLSWLGLGNHQLNELIGEQIDGRLQSVDEQQRANYVESGIGVLGDQNVSLPSRQYALGLLRRLKPKEAIGPLIDLLPKLPPELRPLTGELLEELTGQDYGPKHGGENAEVEAAVAKWRAWWAAHQDPPPPAAAKPAGQGS